jgi:transcription elongation factor GreA
MQVPIRKGDARLFSPLDYHLSPEKYRELEESLKKLLSRRPKEAAEVKRLAEMGDFSENAGYQLAKGRLRGLNQRILDIENLLKKAEIVIADTDTSVVKVGHRVLLSVGGQEKSYTILGASESNPSTGIISHNSPLGAALLGRRPGDTIKLPVNGQEKIYKLIKIEA